MTKNSLNKPAQPQPSAAEQVAALLFASQPDLLPPSHYEKLYPPRQLPKGAMVTRFAPSPTILGGNHVLRMCTINPCSAAHDDLIRTVEMLKSFGENINDKPAA